MLKAVYKSGSACILPNGKDEDYIYYYDTKEERLEALIKNKRRDIDIHFSIVSNAKKVFLGCYIYPFMQFIEGEEIEGLKDFSIFDVKEEYLKLLKWYAKRLPREDKKWYHIYIAVKMFDKGKMSLTKKELNIAQKIHDEGVNCEIYNYIIDYLG